MRQLIDLLKKGVSPSHVIEWMKQELTETYGFCQCDIDELEKKCWIASRGCYVNLYGTNGMAFRIGDNITDRPSVRVAVAHSDYPCLQIKPGIHQRGSGCTRLNAEIYGGMNQKSWFDRPLGVAGKLIVKGNDAFSPETMLYRSDVPIAVIPSLAIHMERDLNKKGEIDAAKELVPIVALDERADLLFFIADSLSISKDDILDYDLFLYNMEEPVLCGMDQSMLAAPKLDNLTSVAALVAGLGECETIPDNTIDMIVVFDNEEVGSRTKQGADSGLLAMVLERVGEVLGCSKSFLVDVAKRSFLLSVDVAHAHHPNYEEKSDVVNKAYLGNGFSLKRSIGQKYGTTAESAAVIKTICSRQQIPYTVAINKTGIAGGSTLGPIVSSYLPFPCADIGMPILAMHSSNELGAVKDYESLKKFVEAYFEE